MQNSGAPNIHHSQEAIALFLSAIDGVIHRLVEIHSLALENNVKTPDRFTEFVEKQQYVAGVDLPPTETHDFGFCVGFLKGMSYAFSAGRANRCEDLFDELAEGLGLSRTKLCKLLQQAHDATRDEILTEVGLVPNSLPRE